MTDQAHKQELEERLKTLDAQMGKYTYSKLSEAGQEIYRAMSIDRQLIVDQLAEMAGALPNDRHAGSSQD